MNIKLSYYTLRSDYNDKHAKHGDLVCPSNGASSVGKVVEIKPAGEDDNDWEGSNYVVLWATGNKKGKRSTHRGHTLVLLKLYLAAIDKDLSKINALIKEAEAFGM